MKVVAIIQARMGSTRLPGKVMLKLHEKTILEHVITRVKQSKLVDEIIIATTVNRLDDSIIEETKKINIKSFRGSEDDVLSRYYYAAKENDADIVIRITSDCPLIDPKVIDEMVEKYLNMTKDNPLDYLSNTIERTYPRGLDAEVFSFKVLEKVFNEATKQTEKEHVTPYIYLNLDKFKIFHYLNNEDYSEHRWTLDTLEDFELITEVYDELYKDEHNFYLEEIIKLFERKPQLMDINKEVEQKVVE